MTTTPAQIAAAFGVTYSEPEWTRAPGPIIEPQRFGVDHYSTLLYVQSRAVDYRGRLDHDHMRCDSHRHPILHAAKRRALLVSVDRKYPTRLRPVDGQASLVDDHDDYDCLSDMLACGWLTVTMPTADHERDVFLDPYGHPIVAGVPAPRPAMMPDVDEAPIRASFYTGMDESWLAAHARWGLTAVGREVAAALRAHKADGGNYRDFPGI